MRLAAVLLIFIAACHHVQYFQVHAVKHKGKTVTKVHGHRYEVVSHSDTGTTSSRGHDEQDQSSSVVVENDYGHRVSLHPVIKWRKSPGRRHVKTLLSMVLDEFDKNVPDNNSGNTLESQLSTLSQQLAPLTTGKQEKNETSSAEKGSESNQTKSDGIANCESGRPWVCLTERIFSALLDDFILGLVENIFWGQSDTLDSGETDSIESGQRMDSHESGRHMNVLDSGETDSLESGEADSRETGQTNLLEPVGSGSLELGQTNFFKLGQMDSQESDEADQRYSGQVNQPYSGQMDGLYTGQSDKLFSGQWYQPKFNQEDQLSNQSNQLNMGESNQLNMGESNQLNMGESNQVNMGQSDQLNIDQSNQRLLDQLVQLYSGQTGNHSKLYSGRFQQYSDQPYQTYMGQWNQLNSGQEDQLNSSQINQINLGQDDTLYSNQANQLYTRQWDQLNSGLADELNFGQRDQLYTGQMNGQYLGQRNQLYTGQINGQYLGQTGDTYTSEIGQPFDADLKTTEDTWQKWPTMKQSKQITGDVNDFSSSDTWTTGESLIPGTSTKWPYKHWHIYLQKYPNEPDLQSFGQTWYTQSELNPKISTIEADKPVSEKVVNSSDTAYSELWSQLLNLKTASSTPSFADDTIIAGSPDTQLDVTNWNPQTTKTTWMDDSSFSYDKGIPSADWSSQTDSQWPIPETSTFYPGSESYNWGIQYNQTSNNAIYDDLGLGQLQEQTRNNSNEFNFGYNLGMFLVRVYNCYTRVMSALLTGEGLKQFDVPVVQFRLKLPRSKTGRKSRLQIGNLAKLSSKKDMYSLKNYMGHITIRRHRYKKQHPATKKISKTVKHPKSKLHHKLGQMLRSIHQAKSKASSKSGHYRKINVHKSQGADSTKYSISILHVKSKQSGSTANAKTKTKPKKTSSFIRHKKVQKRKGTGQKSERQNKKIQQSNPKTKLNPNKKNQPKNKKSELKSSSKKPSN